MLTKLAIENDSRFKLAAGVVYKNSLIATGTNSYKTHPMMLEWRKNEHAVFIHAEIDAIKNALKLVSVEDLKKCSMYIVRVKRPSQYSDDWIHGLAKPCAGCARALAAFNFKEVKYTYDV
ncbi:MAG: deaminase [Burkholderiaceae bacterium]